MQLTPIFTLLPLLAAIASATATNSAPVAVVQQKVVFGVPVYQQAGDQGIFHDEPEDVEAKASLVDDERIYDKMADKRVADDKYAPVSPNQTVVIVVAKSQQTRTTSRTIFTTTGAAGAAAAAATTSGKASGASASATSVQAGSSKTMLPATAEQDDDEDINNGNSSAAQVQYVSPKGRPLTPATSSTMFPINRTIAIRNNHKENHHRHLQKNKLYPKKTKCLTVRRHGLRNRFRAVMEHCNDDQRFWLRSPMSFHFEDAGEDTVVLTWMDPKGVKRCARHDITGTRFYPCNSKKQPTRYEILPTKYEGKFKIKQHGRNRCFDFDHSTLWMNRCHHFRDQALDVITVAFDQN